MSVVALPRVSGRHRNRELAGARQARALELRTQGWTYEAIAEELGYANRGTVYAIVRAAVSAHLADDVSELLALEAARLDSLQISLWDRAMSGDIQAVTEVRRIIDARIRLLGLGDRAKEAEGGGCRTVVCSCATGTGHRGRGRRPK